MEAWSNANQINIWLPKGKVITPQQLLGTSLSGTASKGKHPQTEEEFVAYKKDLKKVAKWHESILKQVREGKKVAKPVDSHTLLIDKHSKKI